MNRRAFLKTTGSGALVTVVTPTGFMQYLPQKPVSSLEKSFLEPPSGAKPQTWWHWMNGNVTKEGITLDLEAMQKAGIGGFQNFDAGTGIPEGPVKYLSNEWLSLKKHAIKEAERLGLEFTMHNCPGWSSSGGPWITPATSMQQMSWSETTISGGKTVSTKLQQPFSLLNYFKDVMVIAFPSLPGENKRLTELVKRATTANGAVDLNRLTGEDASGLTIPAPDNGGNVWLQLEFAEPFEARSVTMHTASVGGGFGNPLFAIESSNDGTNFSKVADISGGGGGFGSPAAALATATFQPVTATYFRIVSSTSRQLANVRISGAPRLQNWVGKANFTGTLDFIGHTTNAHELSNDFAAINPASVLDISNFMKDDGTLQWAAPAGTWTILRIGHTSMGTLNRSAPSTGVGLECDKYSREAMQIHFNKMFEALLPILEPVAKKGTVGLLIDSYEVGMQNWTPKMSYEFKKRRGYDLASYLPAMTGRIVGSADLSERFLWDVRRTHADMIADNYYGVLHELCGKHHMKLYTQPYDRGPFEEMQIGSRVDACMGEFWAGLSQLFANNDTMRRTVKLSSSIAHTNGQKLVLAEAYTAEPNSGKWQQYPYGMKALGDYMFTQGMNRITFHRFAHQPHPTAVPGMTMGPWGTHFDRTNTWFIKGAAWLKYTSRCQSLLQQGLFVADIAYLTSEDAPGFTPVRPHELPLMPPDGYDYDLVNAETILNRVTMQNNRLTLPDGMSYKLLVLPAGNTMTIALLKTLHSLVNDGLVVIGPKPSGTPGLGSFNDEDKEFHRLTGDLWGTGNTNNTTRIFGKGKIFTGMPLHLVLKTLGLKPDFEFAASSDDAPVNYIHKSIGETEIYFIANRRRSDENIVAAFRVHGKTPEIWNPDTGEIIPVSIYSAVDGRIQIPLQMDPSGSLFVVFRAAGGTAKSLRSITLNGLPIITSIISHPAPVLYKNITNNFSIALWVKPEIDIALGRKQLGTYAGRTTTEYFTIHPPSGELLYGKGHVASGLTVGRNGIVLWEREGIDPTDVLVAEMPLSGWTHLTIIYKEGSPAVYVNGTLAKEGKPSGNKVHPGLDAAYQRDGAMYYNGDMTKPVLYNEIIDQNQAKQLTLDHLPSAAQRPAEILAGNKGLLFFHDGRYTLTDNHNRSSSLVVSGTGKIAELNDAWTLSFPPRLGAPSKITLPKLMSLHKHMQEGVKYFSGTVTYSRQFSIPASAIVAGKRLFLDLGRVEVLAEIKVNGKRLTTLWKPPFRIDITDVVNTGKNFVEIAVTNLWPNRLIGDEQLPAEAEFVSGINAGPYSVLSNGAIKKLPDWYAGGKPKPEGGRITFTTWKHYHADSPLLESGLIGPVLLLSAILKKQ